MIAERKCKMVSEITSFLRKTSKPNQYFNSKEGMISTTLTQAEVRYILRMFFNQMNNITPRNKWLILLCFSQYHEPIRKIDGSLYRVAYHMENTPCVVFNSEIGNRSFTKKHRIGMYRADKSVPYTLINRLYNIYKDRAEHCQ